ncbi:SipW-dependent-type signal peptide-containing protein [Leucobacter chromiireducens]|uniref:SipW-dependent-type signal peptide-containing protein n=1 Tax=Leucobacter chromiireducens TaxID=283877 RepID=UPI001F14EF74|nr:SipW-dependent-type signal peptide-containing protein [Leucobacter chromiireducens]
MGNTAETKRTGWTRARAVLAGGLVLGVGTAVTLAAWTDTEWVRGVFGSGSFGIEGSADGTAFSDHPVTGAPDTLTFQMNADALAPGDAVYAGYAVQLIAGATHAANVTLTTDTSDAITGTSASFVYTTAAGCSASAFTTGTDANVTSFTLATPETPAFLCFQITADDTLPQGASGEIVWTFTAESGDPV